LSSTSLDNPILNSPFEPPVRHWRFDARGITPEVLIGRRPSTRFVPIAKAKKQSKPVQQSLNEEWTGDRIEVNRFINEVRVAMDSWRAQDRPGLSSVSRELLRHWTRPEREPRGYWCQIEAIETAMFLAECAERTGCAWIGRELKEVADAYNAGLYRVAFKMATGTGKTALMAMLIAWHVLNRQHDKTRGLFSDCFLIVAPGITIRDRLRVLLPSDPDNIYQALDLVPPERLDQLGAATIVITNYHAFLPRETVDASKMTKSILASGGGTDAGSFKETPAQVARRVCRPFGSRKQIVVLNDEAHHCYQGRSKSDGEDDEKLSGDEKKEAKAREEEARVWLTGLQAVQQKCGIRSVYDVSATPFFLSGSGYREGTLFPWVVSDFSLIDAIEAGIVKVPRVPVDDNNMTGALPMYREIWSRIKDDLPKKGRKDTEIAGPAVLPKELEAALWSLYGHYEQDFARWEKDTEARARGRMPPVFIVVCNNTATSKLVYDYIAGQEIGENELGAVLTTAGALPIFSNQDAIKGLDRPRTLLIDSEQLERDDAMSDDFKKLVAHEIDVWKHECKARMPGADVDKVSDKDLLREVMNTVGKRGKLGESIRCVVSVSMLTEGWDVNTVTHVLGVRAFGTQLLCEQVVGRALRRTTFATEERAIALPDGTTASFESFAPEYADVYGVPFQFIQTTGQNGASDKPVTRIRALPERAHLAIRFPRVAGYQYVLPRERLTANFQPTDRMVLSTEHVATMTENAPIVGRSVVHDLEDLRAHRLQEVTFKLAKLVLEKYFRQDHGQGAPSAATDSQEVQERLDRGENAMEPRWDSGVQAWRFPEVLAIVREWLDPVGGWLQCKDDTFPQLLLLVEHGHDAADRIYRGIVRSTFGEKTLRAVLRRFDPEGSTEGVEFDTRKDVWDTRADRCHLNYVASDTKHWEQKVAQSLEALPMVRRYVKNERLGFTIPYTLEGREHQYVPDFIAGVEDGRGEGDLLQLVLECSGQQKIDKQVKCDHARDLWVKGVNALGGFGRWAFLELKDPWNAKTEIGGFVEGLRKLGMAQGSAMKGHGSGQGAAQG